MMNFLNYLLEKKKPEQSKKEESTIKKYKVNGRERIENRFGSIWEKDPDTGKWSKIVDGLNKPEDKYQSLVNSLKRRRTEKEKQANTNRIKQALANLEKGDKNDLPYDNETVGGWIDQWYADNGYTWDSKLSEWVPPKGKGLAGQGGRGAYNYSYEPCSAEWVKKGYLARSCRPGYPDSKNVDEDDAEEWLECVEDRLGTLPKTIITFLDNEELYGKDYKLGFYTFNLIDWYKNHGIETKWFPTKDPIYDPNRSNAFTKEKLDEIMKAIKESPKPVLIHCSAGIDRTGEVVHYFKTGKEKPKFDSFKNYRASRQSQVDKFKNRYGWDYEKKDRSDDNPMVTYGD